MSRMEPTLVGAKLSIKAPSELVQITAQNRHHRLLALPMLPTPLTPLRPQHCSLAHSLVVCRGFGCVVWGGSGSFGFVDDGLGLFGPAQGLGVVVAVCCPLFDGVLQRRGLRAAF